MWEMHDGKWKYDIDNFVKVFDGDSNSSRFFV